MATVKTDKKLYERLRAHGLRKKVARQLSELPSQRLRRQAGPKADPGDTGPPPRHDHQELKGHTHSGNRKAAARKAARTRKAKADHRARSAKKGARARAS